MVELSEQEIENEMEECIDAILKYIYSGKIFEDYWERLNEALKDVTKAKNKY